MAERKKKLPNRHVFSDDELDNPSQTQVLERVKSDRMIASTSIDEDKRRRTIVVEKKNGSFGFTLQSYGIHYQKEQEVEMLTYVDHVEYDGPAFKAGMREGDVILSINGTDMEHADHKTLVNFIKGCDNRMRMVVLFENCVRKVELHMRYIQLQEILQNKMAELEGVVLKEKEILEGKWKTHSLPARKKATDNGKDSEISPSDPEVSTLPYTRPLSTEDVAKLSKQQNNQIIPPPAQFILAYQYLDPYHKHIIKSSTPNSSGECLVSNASSSLPRSHNNFIMSSNENNSYTSLTNQQSPLQRVHHHHHHVQDSSGADFSNVIHKKKKGDEKSSKSRHYHVGHSCNPCMGHFITKRDKSIEKDNASLDAYDLASPCCEANCVPVKRRSRHHKEHHHKHKHRDKDRPPRPKSQSNVTVQTQGGHIHTYESAKHDHRANHYDMSAHMASHCNIHSCNTNEHCHRTAVENPGYTSSLSTDTLWDPKSEPASCTRQQTIYAKPRPASVYHPPTSSTHSYVQHRYIHPSQVQPMQSNITTTHAYIPPQYNTKQKSWDNLTKAYSGQSQTATNTAYMKAYQVPHIQQIHQTHVVIPRKTNPAPYGRYSTFQDVENYVPAPQAFVEAKTITKTTIITTKSTENLISNAQYSSLDDSCECLIAPSQQPTSNPTQQQLISSNCAACNAANFNVDHSSYQGYYSNLTRNNPNRYIPTKTEVTRL